MRQERLSEAGLLPSYRVLDLADEKSVFCTKLLADLGADVIKIEPPTGDNSRRRGPFFQYDVHPEKSLYFLYYNTSKKSITLNLEHPDGQAIFRELAKAADVVVECFPVGYLKGLGLNYEVLAQDNPKLVMASITPFGQTGPLRNYKSSDLINMAMSGYMQITGDPDTAPVRLGDEQSHFAPSQYAAVAIVAALYYRDTLSGTGQYIDISMQEAIYTYYIENHPVLTWLLRGENVVRPGLFSRLTVPMGVFPCKDGLVSLTTISPREWDTLAQWVCEVTGNREILDSKYKGGIHARANYFEEIMAYLTDFTSRWNVAEVFQEAQRRDIAVIPVNTTEDLINNPHLEASDFWVELDHPVVGKLRYPRGPFDSEDIPVPKTAAPLLGEHNEEIYCGELGFSKKDLTILRSAGVI